MSYDENAQAEAQKLHYELNNLLCHAVEQNFCRAIPGLIEMGADPSCFDGQPVKIALRQNRHEPFRLLIAAGADTSNVRDWLGSAKSIHAVRQVLNVLEIAQLKPKPKHVLKAMELILNDAEGWLPSHKGVENPYGVVMELCDRWGGRSALIKGASVSSGQEMLRHCIRGISWREQPIQEAEQVVDMLLDCGVTLSWSEDRTIRFMRIVAIADELRFKVLRSFSRADAHMQTMAARLGVFVALGGPVDKLPQVAEAMGLSDSDVAECIELLSGNPKQQMMLSSAWRAHLLGRDVGQHQETPRERARL